MAQRTRRLRFGPLVYTLSLHHPLRVAEEICMLDQMSGGRLELGVGRGISPHEVAYYGVDPAKAQAMYIEACRSCLTGLSDQDAHPCGRALPFRDVPIELEPVQRPHPPLWYGLARPEACRGWSPTGQHRVQRRAALVRQVTDGYRSAGRRPGTAEQLPLMGMTRTVVVAETDGEALDIARRAHERWHHSFMQLWNKHGTKPINAVFPDNFDDSQKAGFGFAGTPENVVAALKGQMQRRSQLHRLPPRLRGHDAGRIAQVGGAFRAGRDARITERGGNLSPKHGASAPDGLAGCLKDPGTAKSGRCRQKGLHSRFSCWTEDGMGQPRCCPGLHRQPPHETGAEHVLCTKNIALFTISLGLAGNYSYYALFPQECCSLGSLEGNVRDGLGGNHRRGEQAGGRDFC